MNKFKDKLLKIYKRAKLFSKAYLKTNVLFISYVLVSLFNATILRFYTVEKFWNIKPILADLAVILLIGCIGYFIKPKKQFNYYFIYDNDKHIDEIKIAFKYLKEIKYDGSYVFEYDLYKSKGKNDKEKIEYFITMIGEIEC